MPCARSNSRCCCDFSTREPGKPNLSSIEVVSDIFYQAARKSANRLSRLEIGEMSPEEYAREQQRLTDWIGITFSGDNIHYASSEDWNPRGLAQYAKNVLYEEIQQAGFKPEEDTEFIFALSYLYVKELEKALERHIANGEEAKSFPLSKASIGLVHWWSRLMTGAPVEVLIGQEKSLY